MKPLVAGLVTVGLIVAAIALGRGGAQRVAGTADKNADTPAARIAEMFRAAQQGEVDAYRDCFDGDARRQLEHDWASQPPADVSHSLSQSVSALKGFAIQDAAESSMSAAATDAMSLAVERVFEHHNEVQIYDLRRTSAGWKILAIRTRQPRTPAIAYGTPVYDLSPAEMKPSGSAPAETPPR